MNEKYVFNPFEDLSDLPNMSEGVGIIPYYVRYAPDLNLFQKFLYGEITSQFDSKGRVYINDIVKHFSELLNLSDQEVLILIDDMSQKRYINCFIDENEKEKGIFILRKRIL